MSLSPTEIADRIIGRFDNEVDLNDKQRDERRKILIEEIEKIFRMAEATIRNTLSRVRVCDD